jgi:hypothetical protein
MSDIDLDRCSTRVTYRKKETTRSLLAKKFGGVIKSEAQAVLIYLFVTGVFFTLMIIQIVSTTTNQRTDIDPETGRVIFPVMSEASAGGAQ